MNKRFSEKILRIREALSLIELLLKDGDRTLYFSKGYLNSEGRKLVLKLLETIAEASSQSFSKLKRLYPHADEDKWLKALVELKEDLESLELREA